MASSAEAAVGVAARVGYPVLVRPSYVLGGRAMRVCYDEWRRSARRWSTSRGPKGSAAVLVDRFLEGAIELDVDAVCDGARDVRRPR